jgi:hypothetical protein
MWSIAAHSPALPLSLPLSRTLSCNTPARPGPALPISVPGLGLPPQQQEAGRKVGRAGRASNSGAGPEGGEGLLGDVGGALVRSKVLPASEQFDPELYLRVIHAVRRREFCSSDWS